MKKKNVSVPKHIKNILDRSNQGIKLDLGCGENKQPNFVGMDYRKLKGVDIVHNVEKYPYPLPDECCSTVVASHLVEHINPHGGVFINFMNEVWRIMKKNGQFLIAVPYAGSPGYWQDPTHCNGCNEVTWEYFDPEAPVTRGGLWAIYKPKPWKIDFNSYGLNGNLEVILTKRAMKKEYK